MPRNFKEALLFTILMCGMMVYVMSLWNLLILDWTGVVPFAWGHFFQGYLPGFVVAFLLDMILVGPLAKTIAFAILHKVKAHDKRWAKILVISGTMALFMVTFMSWLVQFHVLSWENYKNHCLVKKSLRILTTMMNYQR